LAVNRKDLLNLPVPNTTLLWRHAHAFVKAKRIRIDITVEGIADDQPWKCGLEFDYDNEESLTCRPLRLSDQKQPPRMPVPMSAREVKLAYLPPMSGLVAREDKLEPGAIAVRIGEGRTAEVLRNLCHRLYSEKRAAWDDLAKSIAKLFGARLNPPEHLVERGEIEMTYEEDGVTLDLSSGGRGLQQTLLLLAYLHANPNSVLLLDEPDAHLEILRQRHIYEVLTSLAAAGGSQIIAASHSEVLLNEAAGRDVVIAFVGKPHRIDARSDQVHKALQEIGFEHYYQAERKGWVLYLEGSTDLEILRKFAQTLAHPAAELLENPFVHYVGNQAYRAREHFYGLREAKSDLVGIAILDRDATIKPGGHLIEMKWGRREIENYLAFPEVLIAFAEQSGQSAIGPLFSKPEGARRRDVMEEVVQDWVPPAALRDPSHRFWSETKVSDEFLTPVFDSYFKRLGLENVLRKTNYHVLAPLVPIERLSPEITEKLDAIAAVATAAKPA
jgi:hypothetical protein